MTLKTKVRMYKLNELGDCFQLSFSKGAKTTNILIDCGTFRNSGVSKAKLKEVLNEVYKETGKGAIDIVVATHQHNDHVSGFVHNYDTFKKYGIKEAWLSWLDDPKDTLARKIGNDHNNLALKLSAVAASLNKPGKLKKENPLLVERVKDIAGFYMQGVAQVPKKGIENLKSLSENVTYLTPGQTLRIPGFNDTEVKVYVLGPPRDTKNLYDINPNKDETYDKHLGQIELGLKRYMSALSNLSGEDEAGEKNYPFDSHKKITKAQWRKYMNKNVLREFDKEDKFRGISNEWLQNLESLALYLDTYTNNSSLVLAFELVKEKKVMLFVGDAQTGNWLSWKTIDWKKAGNGKSTGDGEAILDDLLSRTVLYKVGHHASHNATLKASLEKMTHPDLVAMIPVHKDDPNITKENGWKMPATNLYKRLKEIANYKVLRMDEADGFADECNPKTSTGKGWGDLAKKLNNTPLFVEIEI